MRALPVLLVILLPVTASAQAMPKLKAGLWEQTTAVEGLPAGMMKPALMCVDDASQARWSLLGQRMAACSATQMQRAPDGLRFSSTCNMSGMKTSTTGVVRGDFNSRYEVVSTTTGAGPKPSTVRSTARYLGACKDLKPGQMRIMGSVVSLEGGR